VGDAVGDAVGTAVGAAVATHTSFGSPSTSEMCLPTYPGLHTQKNSTVLDRFKPSAQAVVPKSQKWVPSSH
jgi:hypothetical protein